MRQVVRKLGVRLRPEPVDVRPSRQSGRIDLDHRTENDELPVRPQVGEFVEEIGVETFIHDAEEPQARMRDRSLIGRVSRDASPSAGEMRRIDRGWEAMDVRMSVAFRGMEAVPAGEDEVGLSQQSRLLSDQRVRCTLEGRQLIHVVVERQIAL